MRACTHTYSTSKQEQMWGNTHALVRLGGDKSVQLCYKHLTIVQVYCCIDATPTHPGRIVNASHF